MLYIIVIMDLFWYVEDLFVGYRFVVNRRL